LDQGFPEKAFNVSCEAEKALEQVQETYEKARKTISTVQALIREHSGQGQVFLQASELLESANRLFTEGKYEEAFSSAAEAERVLKKGRADYHEATEWLNAAETIIARIQAFCSNTEAAELLARARGAFGEGSYEEALNLAKQAEQTAKRLKEQSKPVLEIKLSDTSFKPNLGKRMKIEVANRGSAHAKDIAIAFSKEIEVKGLRPLVVNAGETTQLEVNMVPQCQGDVLLECSCSYKDFENKEYRDEKRFWISVGKGGGIEGEPPQAEGGQKPLIVQRETEFYKGFIRLRISVMNPMSQVVTDVVLELDIDEHILRCDHIEPPDVRNHKVLLQSISPGSSKTVTFYLDPQTCTKAGTEINCRIGYKDAQGKPYSVQMESKKVEVTCPIFQTDSDINVGMLKELVEELPHKDCKIFRIPEGLEMESVIRLCRETIQPHDVRHIRTFKTRDGMICETWYYGRTKVEKNDIVIKASIEEKTKIIELFAATRTEESLTGMLAELGHNLTNQVKEIGKKSEQIFNLTLEGNVIQKCPNLLNFLDSNGVSNDKDIIIEETLSQRSSSREQKAHTQRDTFQRTRTCTRCGIENNYTAKFCTECGIRLARTCVQCGKEAEDDTDKYCKECGTKLP